MFLIIDNSEEGRIILSFLLNNKFVQRIYKKTKNPSALIYLEKLLFGLKLTLKDIKYLGVVVGAGRFTASRLAVTAANALAFSLKIPVVGLPKNFNQTSVLKKIKSVRAGRYVLPKYSGEARVSR
jgi:tRNA A37 threonylcarbamoyladenosine modification protein TsaB